MVALSFSVTVVHAQQGQPAGRPAQAQQPPKPKPPAYLTAEEAPRDFKYQGEYVVEDAAVGKHGIQMISLGQGKFRAVIFAGGLPGAGWDGQRRVEAEGGLHADTLTCTTKGDRPMTVSVTGDAATLEVNGAKTPAKKVERKSPTLGAMPPAGAVVLFDGKSAGAWNGGKVNDRGLLNVGVKSKQAFGDFTLHLEFLLPFMPTAGGQGRGNSGVYLQDRYEVQVLDSFGLKGADNECGGIYQVGAPAVNMCLPPLQWQTYDIDFTAAKFEGGKKVKNAVVTVRHNGVVIHDNKEIPKQTGGGQAESERPGPIQLQNHGDPVFFRNIWVMPK